MKTSFTILAAIAGLAVLPAGASAKTPDVAPGAAAVAATAASTLSPAPAPREQRYCFVDTVTGSLLKQKVCKTRSQWTRLGVELPAAR